jgi:hypothetical protein
VCVPNARKSTRAVPTEHAKDVARGAWAVTAVAAGAAVS